MESSSNGWDNMSCPEIAGELAFEHPNYYLGLSVIENSLSAAIMPNYNTSNSTIILPDKISPEYTNFNRKHKVLRRQDRTTMVIIDENGYEYAEAMQTIQMFTKYNRYGNNPHVQAAIIPFEPHSYPVFARICNTLDERGFFLGTHDYKHSCFNYVTKGSVATLVDMQAHNVDILPPLPMGMVLVREGGYSRGSGGDYWTGLSQMAGPKFLILSNLMLSCSCGQFLERTHFISHTSAMSHPFAQCQTAIRWLQWLQPKQANAPEMQALRREKQHQLAECWAAKSPEGQETPIASGSGSGTAETPTQMQE
ncbi:hypothetical protein B0H14DRAFT_2591132 [Mycena olivaceomarginata]|nr:hypothetical protein B0H14DRAFT_2591132 [Mycena olivaceomarginata]